MSQRNAPARLVRVYSGIPLLNHRAELTVPECPDCTALGNAPATRSPHAGLLLHSESNINFSGTASGRVEYYVCHLCGTKWEREIARSARDAVWRHTERQLT